MISRQWRSAIGNGEESPNAGMDCATALVDRVADTPIVLRQAIAATSAEMPVRKRQARANQGIEIHDRIQLSGRKH